MVINYGCFINKNLIPCSLASLSINNNVTHILSVVCAGIRRPLCEYPQILLCWYDGITTVFALLLPKMPATAQFFSGNPI